jgi:hypothetical protein
MRGSRCENVRWRGIVAGAFAFTDVAVLELPVVTIRHRLSSIWHCCALADG